MEKYKNALAALISTAVLLSAGLLLLNYLKEDTRQPHSSHGTDPRGVKAFYLLLKESGLPVQRWNSPLTRLQEVDAKEVMVIVEPVSRRLHYREAEALHNWVQAGNRVLMLGRMSPFLWEAFEIEYDTGPGSVQPVAVEEQEADHSLLKGVKELTLHRGKSFKKESRGTPLVAEGERYYLLYREVGEGELVAVADPGIMTNHAIPEGDNLIFLLNVVGAFDDDTGAAYFNEYHHGFGLDRTAEGFSPGGGMWSYLTLPLAQLLLFTVLLLLTMGKRFSAPRPLTASPGPSLENMVASTQALYRQAGAGKLAFRILYGGFKRRLARKYRLGSRPGLKELVELGERVTGTRREELEADFYRLEKALPEKRVSEAELYELARLADRYRKEFDL